MATTASGITIPGSSPTTTQATPIQDHWNNLGKSLNGRIVVPVASVTARAALVSALTAEGYTISASNPLYTYRADARVGSEFEVTVNGTTWRAVNSGPFAQATGSFYGGANLSTVGFPTGRFTVTPLVTLFNQVNAGDTPTTPRLIPSNIDTTGFTYQNMVNANNTLIWTAIQMTPTSAAG